jgi:hypothetical protein
MVNVDGTCVNTIECDIGSGSGLISTEIRNCIHLTKNLCVTTNQEFVCFRPPSLRINGIVCAIDGDIGYKILLINPVTVEDDGFFFIKLARAHAAHRSFTATNNNAFFVWRLRKAKAASINDKFLPSIRFRVIMINGRSLKTSLKMKTKSVTAENSFSLSHVNAKVLHESDEHSKATT